MTMMFQGVEREYFTVEFHCLNGTQRREVDEFLCKHFKRGKADKDGARISGFACSSITTIESLT